MELITIRRRTAHRLIMNLWRTQIQLQYTMWFCRLRFWRPIFHRYFLEFSTKFAELQYQSWVYVGERMTNRLRIEFFKAIMRQEISWFDKSDHGSLVQKANEFVFSLMYSYLSCILQQLGAFQRGNGRQTRNVNCNLHSIYCRLRHVFGVQLATDVGRVRSSPCYRG